MLASRTAISVLGRGSAPWAVHTAPHPYLPHLPMAHRIHRAALTRLPIRSPRIRSFRHRSSRYILHSVSDLQIADLPFIHVSTHPTGVPVRMTPFRPVWRRSSLRFLKFLVDKKLAPRTPNPVGARRENRCMVPTKAYANLVRMAYTRVKAYRS